MTLSCWKVGLGVFNTGKNNFNYFFIKKYFKKHESYNKSVYTFKYPEKQSKTKNKTQNPKTF
jgi:hypothetical protein